MFISISYVCTIPSNGHTSLSTALVISVADTTIAWFSLAISTRLNNNAARSGGTAMERGTDLN